MTAPSGFARDEVVLALTNISKRFGNTVALDRVSLAVRRGTVHAIAGENGAGKTTLMRIAFGLVPADSGSIFASGATRMIRSAADAIAAHVGMVHQHFTNIPAMTVAQNVALGGHGLFDHAAAAARVRAIGAQTGLALDPASRVEGLSVGAQQRLEIVKALARDAQTLILDEPTAVLAPTEAQELLQWLRRFANDGNAVVLITHKLREALQVADEVTVLRRGAVVLSAPARTLTEPSLAAALLGEDLPPLAHGGTAKSAGAVVIRAVGVDVRDDRGVTVVHGATFDARAGEIVGIAAIEGAGQYALLRALAKRRKIAGGELTLPASIGFVPEDRHRDALVLDFSVPENIALDGAGSRRGRMDWSRLREQSRRMVRDYDVHGDGGAPVRALSGGNQQKLVLARELDGGPQLVVAENPTRGLDIRATANVHDRLRAAAAAGAAAIVYSSDLDEVLSLASRVLVVHSGSVQEAPLERGAVGRAMLGVA